MKKYLVVGVYADDLQRWADSFVARDPVEAEELAHKATGDYELIVAAVIDMETCEVVV
jgi:hypothetical protein